MDKQKNYQGRAPKTNVQFYVHRENKELFAYFPDHQECYAHIGQHSGIHPDYIKECHPATLLEREDLKNELTSIGYNLHELN